MVIEEICAGATAYRDIREKPVFPIVRGWLTHEQAMALESYCPEKIILPRKKHPAKIEYTDDAEADARRMNEWIESEIRHNPEQYLWVHKRFKTRPEGEGSVY